MNQRKVFDTQILKLRACFQDLPDHRRGNNTQYEIEDAASAAFSVFFSQSPSFLAHQRLLEKKKGKSNLQSLFAIKKIPSDNQIRNLLDPLSPELLAPLFFDTIETLEAEGEMESYRGYDDRILISNDGTETVSSQKIDCPECSQRSLQNSHTHHFHSAILPVIVKSGEKRVLPLAPEFITPQPEYDKQDSERAAMKRWIEKHQDFLKKGRYTMLGDDLYANQPMCKAFIDAGLGFILVCKPDSHIELYKTVNFLAGNHLVEELEERHWNGRYHEIHRYRFVNEVPLRSEDPLMVNWLEITILNESTGERVYFNSFITMYEVTAGNVVELAEEGRTRWKSENETNNTLKNQGYNLEHNFGHGKEHLANFLTSLNLLAFLLHTTLAFLDEEYQALRRELVVRKEFFNDIRALLRYMVFESWTDLLLFMLRALEVPQYMS